MAKQKFDQSYIHDASVIIEHIVNAKREDNGDYTRIALSIQDAVQAARTVYGTVSQEEIHLLRRFITEITCTYMHNISNNIK